MTREAAAVVCGSAGRQANAVIRSKKKKKVQLYRSVHVVGMALQHAMWGVRTGLVLWNYSLKFIRVFTDCY